MRLFSLALRGCTSILGGSLLALCGCALHQELRPPQAPATLTVDEISPADEQAMGKAIETSLTGAVQRALAKHERNGRPGSKEDGYQDDGAELSVMICTTDFVEAAHVSVTSCRPVK